MSMQQAVDIERTMLVTLPEDLELNTRLLEDAFTLEDLQDMGIDLDTLFSLSDETAEGWPAENSFWCFKYGSFSVLKKATYIVEDEEQILVFVPATAIPVIPKFASKNLEQTALISAIYDPSLLWVTVFGGAGTGKTFVALSCALALLEQKKYDRIILVKSRAQAFTGSSGRIGDVPGGIVDKLLPTLGSFMRAFSKIWGKNYISKFEEYLNQGKIEIAALEYMRGEDYSKALILCDEAQNTELHQFGTLLTRIGEGSKLLMLADTDQIDERENRKGMQAPIVRAITTQKYMDSKITSFITLVEQERGPLVSLAIEIMKELRA